MTVAVRESENAFTAEDIMKLRTRERIENVGKKVQNLDTKLDKSLLSERRKCELEGEKDALTTNNFIDFIFYMKIPVLKQ